MNETNKMNTVYRSEKTFNGFSLDVVKSALQKYIRRCDARKAIYAGIELDLFYMMPEKGEGIRTNFIHRIMVIYMEDLFYPGLWEYVDHHIFSLFSLRQERLSTNSVAKIKKIREEEMQNITTLIYALSNSSHSRDNSYYRYCLSIYLKNNEEEKNRRVATRFPFLEDLKERSESHTFRPSFLPEMLRDISKNTSLYKTISQFIGAVEEKDDLCIYYGHLLAEMEPPKKFYNSKKPAYMIFYLLNEILGKDKKYKKYVEIGKRWYRELSPLKEDFLCWQTILLFWLKDNKENKKYYIPYEVEKEDEKVIKHLTELYEINLLGNVVEFDEWVYDMHTKIGKRRGKGSHYFATESSFVCNEFENVNQVYKNAYLYRKMIDDPSYVDVRTEKSPKKSVERKRRSRSRTRSEKSVERKRRGRSRTRQKNREKESDFSRFLVRAQLVTGNMKTDTYYGEKDGKVIFIKGPLKDDKDIHEFLELQQIKEKLGLPTLHYQVVYLIPDLFGKTPLGLRNRINRDEKHPFIVCDTLFDHSPDNIPIRIHSSKLWPPTELVDFDKVKGMEHLKTSLIKNDRMMSQLVETLIFRYVYGLGDLAPRNFILSNNQIYSIDEDIVDASFDFERNVKRIKDFFPKFKEYVKKNKKKVKGIFEKYSIIKLSDSEKERFDWIENYLSTL